MKHKVKVELIIESESESDDLDLNEEMKDFLNNMVNGVGREWDDGELGVEAVNVLDITPV
jgi:hypothetical protein